MGKATMTFEDRGNGRVVVRVTFDPPVTVGALGDMTPAQRAAHGLGHSLYLGPESFEYSSPAPAYYVITRNQANPSFLDRSGGTHAYPSDQWKFTHGEALTVQQTIGCCGRELPAVIHESKLKGGS